MIISLVIRVWQLLLPVYVVEIFNHIKEWWIESSVEQYMEEFNNYGIRTVSYGWYVLQTKTNIIA